MKNLKQISYIEEHEEEEAIRFVEEKLGCERPRVCGPWLAVMLYTRHEETYVTKEGEKSQIVVPGSVADNDTFSSMTGLVLSIGHGAYKGEQFKEYGPTCKVGDWITFPRHEGVRAWYKGRPIYYLYDDKIMQVVKDPADVTRD
jgi:co-chaperonin GroES (HSP10)